MQVLRDFLCVTCVTSFCSMVEVKQVSPTSYGAPDVDLEFVGTLGREKHQETFSSPPASSDSHGSESDVSRLGSHTSSGKLLDPTEDQEWQTAAANFMSTLQPTRDEVLRGVAAFHVLKDFGKIFRRRHDDYGKLYGLGRQMEWIDEFWSHSWKGSPLAKIWLFLMLKNGIAALVIGSCIALILAILSFMRYLPGYNKVPSYVEPEFAGEYHFAPWANLGGNLSALVTLLLWRSRGQIFIDLVCIHQQDPQLKAEGLLNLGAFLNRSKQLIVACDNIYWTRAWCVFEVAAFLKSHGNSAKIVIRPTALAGVTFYFVLSTSSLIMFEVLMPAGGIFLFVRLLYLLHFALLAYVMREYWHMFFETEEQIRNFRWEAATCNCCERNHVSHDGKDLPCDKDVLGECISNWFGSIENFNQTVQTQVLSMYQRQLGRSPLGYGWLVAISTCFLWGSLDHAASYGPDGLRLSLLPLILFLPMCLWVNPASWYVYSAVCRWYAKQLRIRTRPVRILFSVLVLWVLTWNGLLPQIYNWSLLQLYPDTDPILRRIIFAISTLPFCVIAICFLGRSCQEGAVNAE